MFEEFVESPTITPVRRGEIVCMSVFDSMRRAHITLDLMLPLFNELAAQRGTFTPDELNSMWALHKVFFDKWKKLNGL